MSESFLPVGTVVGSLVTSPQGARNSIPPLSTNNFAPIDAAIQITDKAMTLSSMTTAERDLLNPWQGMIIFNTDTAEFEGYDGFDWSAMGGGGGGGLTPSLVTGNVQMSPNFLYIINTASAVNLTLPLSANVSLGDEIKIIGALAGIYTIVQTANLQVRVGINTTTVGVAGTTIANSQGCILTLTYCNSNLWVGSADQGAFTLA